MKSLKLGAAAVPSLLLLAALLPGASSSTTAAPGPHRTTLLPSSVEQTADGTVVTHFPHGVTFAGGPVLSAETVEDATGMTVRVQPDYTKAFATPAEYAAAGRSPLRDYQALIGQPDAKLALLSYAKEFGQAAADELSPTLNGIPVTLSAVAGDVIETGSVAIETQEWHAVSGYQRKLAYKGAGPEVILETAKATGRYNIPDPFTKMTRLSVKTIHDGNSNTSYLVDWDPYSDTPISSSCSTREFGVEYSGFSLKTSANVCKEKMHVTVARGSTDGSVYDFTEWQGSVPYNSSQGIALADSYRWGGTGRAHGGMILELRVQNTNGAKNCIAHNYTCT